MRRMFMMVALMMLALVGCAETAAPVSGVCSELGFFTSESCVAAGHTWGIPGMQMPQEPAGPTCDEGCDDGDPCTEDSCVQLDNTCEHAVIAGCTIYACNGLGVIDAESLMALGDGDSWKVAGEVAPHGEPSSCTEEACVEPCCNSCDVALGLEVDGQALTTVSTDRDIAWGCSSDDCGSVYTCEPLLLDSNYWLWGKVVEVDDEVNYIAQGWCRQTTADALPGEYLGTWVSDAGEAHTVQLTIGHLATWSISIQGVRDCEACAFSIPSQIASGVFVGDGALEFVVNVCTDGAVCEPSARRDVIVTLSSHEDRLIGTFEEASLMAGLGAPYAGAVGLERLLP